MEKKVIKQTRSRSHFFSLRRSSSIDEDTLAAKLSRYTTQLTVTRIFEEFIIPIPDDIQTSCLGNTQTIITKTSCIKYTSTGSGDL